MGKLLTISDDLNKVSIEKLAPSLGIPTLLTTALMIWKVIILMIFMIFINIFRKDE